MTLLNKEKDILPIREQYRICDEILKERIHQLLPQLMKDCAVDMWLLICREYNEDPVFRTMIPSLMKSATRLSCLMFSLNQDSRFEALSLCRPNPMLEPFYKQAYDPKRETQLEAIAKVVQERNPRRVVVNCSTISGQADGLSKQLWDDLSAYLGDRLQGDDSLAVRWLETRTQREMELYPSIYRIAQAIQKEAYSSAVITPGITTTADVEWYIEQRINDMGMPAWFAPYVDLHRKGCPGRLHDVVIEEGDLLHTDMGLTYLRLNTDSQRLAYVPHPGETEIPAGILAGFAQGNRFQDIVREQFVEGRSGNEIFFAAMEQAKAEGIRAMLYTHPIGFYGHGTGPNIGLYDNQGFVPGSGEWKLHNNTCYALELNVTEAIPEWEGQDICFMMEETICFTEGQTFFMDEERDQILFVK